MHDELIALAEEFDRQAKSHKKNGDKLDDTKLGYGTLFHVRADVCRQHADLIRKRIKTIDKQREKR